VRKVIARYLFKIILNNKNVILFSFYPSCDNNILLKGSKLNANKTMRWTFNIGELETRNRVSIIIDNLSKNTW